MSETKKLQQLKEDMEADWWKAGKTDQFNLSKKMARVGCRPLKRKFLACEKKSDYSATSF